MGLLVSNRGGPDLGDVTQVEALRPYRLHNAFGIHLLSLYSVISQEFEQRQVRFAMATSKIGGWNALLTSAMDSEAWPALLKLSEWSALYLMGYCHMGYGYVLFLATALALHSRPNLGLVKAASELGEWRMLRPMLDELPTWVAFPDFDRVEFINAIIRQLWPRLDGYVTFFVDKFIFPEIKSILDHMALDTVSGLQLKRIKLGSIPARVEGIKVYDWSSSARRESIVLDANISYAGDLRVLFSLQGVQAEVNNVHFRGLVRMELKPILTTFPFVGGFEVFLVQKPHLTYNLGGLGALAEMPMVKSVVTTIVEEQLRARWVWPNRFRLILPDFLIDKSYSEASDRDARKEDVNEYEALMPRPLGLLVVRVEKARNLVAKDNYIGGSGKSDPYVVLKVGEQKVSFREQHVQRDLDPVWHYRAEFVLEAPTAHGQSLELEVLDFDNASSDDFMGRKTIDLGHLITHNLDSCRILDNWLTLEDTKRGEVRLVLDWLNATDISNTRNVKGHVLSVQVHSAQNVKYARNSNPPSTRCRLRLNQGTFMTRIVSKTRNPLYCEGFLMKVGNVEADALSLELIEAKNESSVLGRLKVALAQIRNAPGGLLRLNDVIMGDDIGANGNGSSRKSSFKRSSSSPVLTPASITASIKLFAVGEIVPS